ncbi:MAG: hypothetical protein FVQ85_12450 [Planctomycetes bacterium]|nr:hypothetical protein [Planctomycetota bacterium]
MQVTQRHKQGIHAAFQEDQAELALRAGIFKAGRALASVVVCIMVRGLAAAKVGFEAQTLAVTEVSVPVHILASVAVYIMDRELEAAGVGFTAQ